MNAMFFAGKLLGMLVSGREPPGKVRGRRLLHERTVEAGLARYWSPHPSLPVREYVIFARCFYAISDLFTKTAWDV
eukprot:COSAG06_NODE_186_length_20792_cov_1041.487443_16_plen_76_part_00